MNRKLLLFIGLSALITLGLMLIGSLGDKLPSGVQGPASLLALMFFLWVPFGLIVKVIYSFVGIHGNINKLSHRQAEAVNRYWITWLVTAPATAAAFTIIFDRNSWKNNL